MDAQLAAPSAESSAEDSLPRPKRARTQRTLQPGLLNGDLALALMQMPEVQFYEELPQHLVGPKKTSQEAASTPKLSLESDSRDCKELKAGSKRSSIYNGVSWNRNKNNWKVRIRVDGIIVNLGSFTDEKDAARKYDEFAALVGKPLNFPVDIQAENVNDMSKMKGVTWCNDKKKWMARIHVDGKSTHLGCFSDKEMAAQKYDDAAHSLGRPMNFPSTDTVKEDSQKSTKSPKSRYRGVSWSKKGRAWRARICFEGKYSHLGHFHEEEEAALKYDEAAVALGRPLNFSTDGQIQAVKLSSSAKSTSEDVSLHGAKKSKLTQAIGTSKCTHLGHSDTEDEVEEDSGEGSATFKEPSIVPAAATGASEKSSDSTSSATSTSIGSSYKTSACKSAVAASTNISTSLSPSPSPSPSKGKSKSGSSIPCRAPNVANFWENAAAYCSTSASGSADATPYISSAAQAAYKQVSVVDNRQSEATLRLRENRLSGVPSVVVGHHGWARFADAWLLAGGGVNEDTTVGNSVSADNSSRSRGKRSELDVAHDENCDMDLGVETPVSPNSTNVGKTSPSVPQEESKWVPSADDMALAAAHGIHLRALLDDIGDEEVPLVQPRTFIGSQQARESSARHEHLASAVMTTTVGDFVRHAWLAGTSEWYVSKQYISGASLTSDN